MRRRLGRAKSWQFMVPLTSSLVKKNKIFFSKLGAVYLLLWSIEWGIGIPIEAILGSCLACILLYELVSYVRRPRRCRQTLLQLLSLPSALKKLRFAKPLIAFWLAQNELVSLLATNPDWAKFKVCSRALEVFVIVSAAALALVKLMLLMGAYALGSATAAAPSAVLTMWQELNPLYEGIGVVYAVGPSSQTIGWLLSLGVFFQCATWFSPFAYFSYFFLSCACLPRAGLTLGALYLLTCAKL